MVQQNLHIVQRETKEVLEQYELELMEFEDDHDGQAQAVLFQHSDEIGSDIKYTPQLGPLAWDGAKWVADSHKVALMVVETLRERKFVAEKAPSRYGSVIQHSRADAANVSGIMKALDAHTKTDVAELNKDDDKLPAPNGIIDLKTGELLPQDKALGFTYNTNIAYDPDADPSEWHNRVVHWFTNEKLMNEAIARGDNDTAEALAQEAGDNARALQMFVGYMHTGSVASEAMGYLFGDTRSGKGTLVETLRGILPEPVVQAREFSTFTDKRDGDTNNFDLAGLQAARAVYASESVRHIQLNAAKVKNMTGGGSIYAAYKGRDGATYKVKFKILLDSNWPVNADVDDKALWGRLLVLKFPNSYLGKEDTSLKAYWLREKQQQKVLKWVVDGAAMWYANGQKLYVPATSTVEKKAMIYAQDTVSQWLDAEDEVATYDGAFATNKDITTSYEKWCRELNHEPRKAKYFAEALKLRGFTPGKKGGVRGWYGIHIIGKSEKEGEDD